MAGAPQAKGGRVEAKPDRGRHAGWGNSLREQCEMSGRKEEEEETARPAKPPVSDLLPGQGGFSYYVIYFTV